MNVSSSARLSVMLGFAIALFGPILLTGWASLGICLGLHPESLMAMDTVAPTLGLLLGGWVTGRHAARFWLRGLAVGAGCVVLWFLFWLYLAGRTDFILIWKQGVLGLPAEYVACWAFALTLAMLGAWAGEMWSSRRALLAATLAVLVAVPAVQLWTQLGLEVPASADGTTIRFINYDLNAVRLGLYDADSDDAKPFDDRNTTWYSLPLPLVWQKVQRSTPTKLELMVNGGFFGALPPHVAVHEAPIVLNRKSYYNQRKLLDDWPEQAYNLGWVESGGRTYLEMSQEVPFEQLNRRYDEVLGGVRALRINGQSLTLNPGMGNTTLMTSRTSIGWDGQKIYVLSVRDPDGEAAGVRAKNAGWPQVGGWDVRQVQQFWERQGIPNAALFDGGESTQLGFRREAGPVEMTHSSYFFTRTPIYIRSRPLRFVWPTLPPGLTNGGVLNYFYIRQQ